MKAPSPLLGFNNNVRHKGRIFHIQTEDSGIRHPHIITHLFADGGRILKTTKTSYAEHVGTPTMAETVREMMKEQHKAMFIALREGHFDYLFDENAPRPEEAKPAAAEPAQAPAPQPAPPAAATQPTPPAAAPQPAPPPATAASDAASAPAQASLPSAPEPAPPAQPDPVPPQDAAPPPRDAAPPPQDAAQNRAAPRTPPAAAPRPHSTTTPIPQRPTPAAAPAADASRVAAGEAVPPSRRSTSRPRIELDAAALHHLGTRPAAVGGPAARAATPAPVRAAPPAPAAAAVPPPRTPTPSAPEEPAIDLDLDILERAAAEAQTPFQQQIQDLPPPPASVIGRRPGSSAGAYSAIHPPDQPASSPPAAEPQPKGAGRYAPTRPASIFATTRPAEGASIFGEDLISEKSLDEVILSYLAEDLDGPPEKK